MKSAAIFVHGRYPKLQLGFYKKLCQGKYKIAVDGGYSFFKQVKLEPDIIIGDFDSLRKNSVKGINTLFFPQQKDATDTELAVQYCIEKGFGTIDIVMPTVGEPDHLLGLVGLLLIPELSVRKKVNVSVCIVNHECEINILTDSARNFTDCKSDLLSILPFGGPINLTCVGMEYGAKDLLIQPWQTRGMRNIIRANNAKMFVKGRALLIHYWGKRKREQRLNN